MTCRGPEEERRVQELDARRLAGGLPLQAPELHEVHDQVQIAGERHDDALRHARHTDDLAALRLLPRGHDRAQEERRHQADPLERLPDDPPLQTLDVDRDVGQLRQAPRG
jgi:hypothetical protein